jgi:hypothetical protein
MSPENALKHLKVGPAYWETIELIGKFAGELREEAQNTGAWDDQVAAAKAEDPDVASKHVMRGLTHRAYFR